MQLRCNLDALRWNIDELRCNIDETSMQPRYNLDAHKKKLDSS